MGSDWLTTTLGEEFHVIMGQSPSSKHYNDNGSGLPFFQGKKDFTDISPTINTWTEVSSKVAAKEDILLSIRAPIGPVNIAPEKCAVGRGLAAIKPNKNSSYKFVLYLLMSKEGELKKRGTGTTFSAITKSNLLTLPINIPCNKIERSQIVDEIETQFTRLDAAVKGLQEVKRKLDVYRKSVLKTAFEGKYTKKQRDNLSYVAMLDSEMNSQEEYFESIGSKYRKKFNDPVKPDQLPKVPAEWRWVRLQEFSFEVKDGTHDTPAYLEAGIPFVTQKNIKSSGMVLDKVRYISRSDHEKFSIRSNVERGDILISMIGANRGMSCIVNSCEQFSIKNVGLIKPFPNQSSKFIQYYFISPQGQTIILRKSKGGAQAFIGLTELRAWPIPWIIQKEQEQIVQEIESRFSVIDKLEKTVDNALKKAELLRKSILKSAFEGKLVNTAGEH